LTVKLCTAFIQPVACRCPGRILPRLLLPRLLSARVIRGLTLPITHLSLLLDTGRILTLPALILGLNLSRTDLAPVVGTLPLLSLDLSLLLPLLFRSRTLLLSLLFRGRALLLTLLLSRLLLRRPIRAFLILLGLPAVLLLGLILLVLFRLVVPASASLSHRSGDHQRAHRYYSKPPFNIPFHLETPYRNARAK